jgi:hypothetical protein
LTSLRPASTSTLYSPLLTRSRRMPPP